MYTSSTCSGGNSPARWRHLSMTMAPSWCAGREERHPLMTPIGVLVAETTNTLGGDMSYYLQSITDWMKNREAHQASKFTVRSTGGTKFVCLSGKKHKWLTSSRSSVNKYLSVFSKHNKLLICFFFLTDDIKRIAVYFFIECNKTRDRTHEYGLDSA